MQIDSSSEQTVGVVEGTNRDGELLSARLSAAVFLALLSSGVVGLMLMLRTCLLIAVFTAIFKLPKNESVGFTHSGLQLDLRSEEYGMQSFTSVYERQIHTVIIRFLLVNPSTPETAFLPLVLHIVLHIVFHVG